MSSKNCPPRGQRSIAGARFLIIKTGFKQSVVHVTTTRRARSPPPIPGGNGKLPNSDEPERLNTGGLFFDLIDAVLKKKIVRPVWASRTSKTIRKKDAKNIHTWWKRGRRIRARGQTRRGEGGEVFTFLKANTCRARAKKRRKNSGRCDVTLYGRRRRRRTARAGWVITSPERRSTLVIHCGRRRRGGCAPIRLSVRSPVTDAVDGKL